MRLLLVRLLGLASLALCAPLARPDLGDNAAGVNVHLPASRLHLLEKVASLGASWIRVDGNWELFEGAGDVPDVPPEEWSPTAAFSKDQYTWSLMNTVVCRAHEQGLSVFMTLAYTPCWAVDGGGACAGSKPPIPGKYEAFVFAVVRHYSEGIDCGDAGTARVTGLRAPTSAPADPALEEQATYVRLVLEFQLAREWITNTFI